MQRAMARQAEAEREERAKIIAAEGERLAAGELAQAADVMAAHPLALHLRNLQILVEVAVDKNSTVVFPAPLMSTIGELGSFLARGKQAVWRAAGHVERGDRLRRRRLGHLMTVVAADGAHARGQTPYAGSRGGGDGGGHQRRPALN